MKIEIYTDISEYEATQPITHRRGESGYPYAKIHTDEGTFEIGNKKCSDMKSMFKTLIECIEISKQQEKNDEN